MRIFVFLLFVSFYANADSYSKADSCQIDFQKKCNQYFNNQTKLKKCAESSDLPAYCKERIREAFMCSESLMNICKEEKNQSSLENYRQCILRNIEKLPKKCQEHVKNVSEALKTMPKDVLAKKLNQH